MKYTFDILVWLVIVWIKRKQFSEFIDKLRSGSVPKWKVCAELVYKSPYFFLVVFFVVYEFFFDHSVRKHDVFLVSAGAYLVPVLIFMFFMYKGREGRGSKEHIRGAAITDEEKLSRALSSLVDNDSLPITPKIRLPRKYETTHFFTIGRPGCGKSQLFYRIIQKAMNRGDKAIIYDFKGDQVAKFFDPEKHILFNPFDKRCAAWNIFNEIESPLDIRSIANSLIPITGNDPYWSSAARDVFAGILTACYMAGKGTNGELFRCCSMPVQEISDFLSRYPGTETAIRHLEQEKAGASILSIMSSSTQCFEYLRNVKGDFSIRKWASDDSDRRCVFLTNYSEISDTIRPVLSLFIELAGKRVLSLPDDLQRRFFFFIDEFGTLNNLPTIPAMLTNGRSKGMSIWIAIQDMGQMEKIYGKDSSQTIVNSCATSFTFAVNDPATADFISRKIGDREVRQTNISASKSSSGLFSHSNNSTSSSSVSYQTLNERAILPSEIMNLPNLVFFLKMPDYNITPLKLDIMTIADQQAPFLTRDDFRLTPVTGDPEVTSLELDHPEPSRQPKKDERDEFHL